MNATPSQDALFKPKLFSTLRSYNSKDLFSDVSAGLIVGIVALPLAIAFAIASGVTPDRGLVTAIIAGFIISALGGSRVQIGGPTGAFVVIVYNIVMAHGVGGLIISTFMAGFMLVGMGLLKLGTIIRFIPYPLTVGFTSGIAVIIFSSQIKDFFGLNTGALPADFIEKWRVYGHTFTSFNPTTVALSLGSLLVLMLWPRLNNKIPASLLVIGLATALVQLFHLPVETIGSRFGAIPSSIPHPALPSISLSQIQDLVGPAFTIAMLGAIESLLSATVADGMIEGRHRSNTELIAQGIANIITPLFGGIPATGAIARTATNVRNGGKTPIAGMVHALTLLAIMLIFGRFAAYIPLCALAAILVMVSWHMSEWHAFKDLLKAPRMDVTVLVTTFIITILVDLTVAVEVGLVLSMVLFMKRMTDVTQVRDLTREMAHTTEETLRHEPDAVTLRKVPKDVVIFEAEGAFFFGVAERLRDLLDIGGRSPRAFILRMRHVLVLDATGIRALRQLQKSCEKKKIRLILQGVHAQPLFALEKAEFLDNLGRENMAGSLDDALKLATAS